MKLGWLASSRERPPKAEPKAPVAASQGAPAAGGFRGAVHSFAREAASVSSLAASLYLSLALASFRADPNRAEVRGADWVGPVGAGISELLVTGVGVVAWLLPLELLLLSLPVLRSDEAPARPKQPLWARLAGDLVVTTTVAALVHVAFADAHAFGAMPLGGSIGELAGELFRSLFSAVGSFILGLTLIVLILTQRASFSFIELARTLARFSAHVGERGASGLRSLLAAWSEARAIEAQRRAENESGARIVEEDPDAIIAALADETGDLAFSLEPAELAFAGVVTPAPPPVLLRMTPPPAPVREVLEETPTPSPKATRSSKPSKPAAPLLDVPTPSPIAPVAAARPSKKKKEDEIKIVDTSAAREVEKGDTKIVPAVGQGFRLPLIEFMDAPQERGFEVDEAALKVTAAQLERTLFDYGVSGKVEEIHPGPTVTTFEVVPAAGTKVSKVASLADDLALGLSKKVRIIAPIPGKNRIGFEIPNQRRAPVNLKELIEDRRFVEMKAPLPCVMGRDIVGAPYFADLASMPHVIVAGATGAGKSVGLNVILVSLLYRRTPEELRLLMIDPKVVELAPYDGIPHMLLPVVTDMKQAATALRWAVDEMERRYQLFANAGTKNITTYNGFVDRVLAGQIPAPKPPAASKVSAIAADGSEVTVDAAKDGSDVPPIARLPFIVIVVDEFADLMMQQGKDVEASVARLAQKARAAGMHVILATQRPSVDVITGMIKANFPTRVAFRVSQKVDSRTILDEQGAEHLLGRGDMLVKMNGTNDVRRVQCPFISEEETQKVTDFLRLQGKPVYDEDILKPRDEEGNAVDDDDAEGDPLYDQAVQIVADTKRCSTSWLQRKLGIGYNRAAKLVETMERRGLVGPANGSKDREVLIGSI